MMINVKETYKSFLQTNEGIDDYNRFKEILYSEKDSLTDHLFDNHLSKLNLTGTVKILDVGGGDGKRIIKLINCLSARFKCSFILDFVEQSGFMCERFKTESYNISPDCQVNIYNAEIEDVDLNYSYDLILMIHSIFCFENFEPVQKIQSLLKRDGNIFILTNASDSFLGKLKLRLDTDYEVPRYELDDVVRDLKINSSRFKLSSFFTRSVVPFCEAKIKFGQLLEWLSLGSFFLLPVYEQEHLIEEVLELVPFKDNSYLISEREVILKLNASIHYTE